MKHSQLIQHKGIKVLETNYSNLKTYEDIEVALTEGSGYIRDQEYNSVLSLVNFEGTFFSTQITKLFVTEAKKNKPYIKASAIFGIAGLGKIVIDGVVRLTGRDLPTFKTREDALDHLAAK